MKKFRWLMVGLLVLVGLSACASREVLIAKSAVVPDGVDFSGRWTLRPADEETVELIKDAEVAAAGGLEPVVPKTRSSSSQSSKSSKSGAQVHVFLETGVQLKISQTTSGLFISFDRSIVEEYRFGEKRIITVGPVEADRVSGWEGQVYVIVTLDKDEAKMTERYQLSADHNALIRSILIVRNGREQLNLKQVFERI
jgi:hypothetical protein